MRKLLFLFVALSVTSALWAYDFEVNGIYYNYLDGNNVEVTYSDYDKYLGEITIPETVTNYGTTYSVTSIGNYAFRFCSSLTSVTIPNSVTSIGDDAFSYCSSLTSITIPNSVTSIGNDAFYGCSSLTSITIPNSVTSIGNNAFNVCSSITTIVVESGNATYDSRENCNAIIESSTNTLIAGCQNTVIPNSVTSIADAAFNGCSSLTSITIPNSVTSIGNGAFYGCSSLTSITISNSVTSIGDYAFSSCSSLTAITIPQNVSSIGDVAFAGCTSLTSFTIPNSVTSIGTVAFSNCSSLTIVICEAVEVPGLGSGVFYNMPLSEATLYVPAQSLDDYKAADQWKDFGTILPIEEDELEEEYTITYTSTDGNVVTPNATDFFGANIVSNTYENGVGTITFDGPVTSIGESAFWSCSSLTSITIPNSVTIIGDAAFSGCSSLVSITIPNSVTSIHTFAFANCSSLIEVEIPKSVISIGESDGFWWACPGIFMGCNSLQKIIVEEGNPIFDSRDNCNAIIETATNTLIAGCQNTEFLNGIKKIATGAFREFNTLEDIDIPSSVDIIGEAAFYGTGIKKVVIPSNCIVEDATAGSSRTALFGAFAACEQLKDVVIPEGTTRIASGMFAGCSSLESLTIPASVTSIGEWAFYKCDALAAITIPNGVTSIEEGAFMRCSKLTSIAIPSGVTSIGNDAFSGCSSLTSMICEAIEVPELGNNVFLNIPLSEATLYVPAKSLDDYKVADQWKDFGTILPIEEEEPGEDVELQDTEMSIVFTNSEDNDSEIYRQTVTIKVPVAPAITGFTFLYWQPVAEPITNEITIQAIYKADAPTSAPEVYTNPANPAQKLLSNGQVYILKDSKTYTIMGQEME